MSVLDTLRSATRRTREITLCVDSALDAEWDAARADLETAAEKSATNTSLEDPSGAGAPDPEETASLEAPEKPATAIPTAVREAAEKVEAIRERMQSAMVTFKFQNITWTARLSLMSEHPPREGSIVDGFRGYNIETFLPAITRTSCVGVVGADEEEQTDIPEDVWDGLLTALNFKQVNLLFSAALDVNEQETNIPTSARFLLESQDSEASSTPPAPGTSPQSGSVGGSRPTSRKSTATKKATSSE